MKVLRQLLGLLLPAVLGFILGNYCCPWPGQPPQGLQWRFSAAAARGNVAEMERLYWLGAKIDDIPMEGNSIQGVTALQGAADSGRAAAVEWLLAHDADPNRVSMDATPLGSAKHHLHSAKRTVEALENRGARLGLH